MPTHFKTYSTGNNALNTDNLCLISVYPRNKIANTITFVVIIDVTHINGLAGIIISSSREVLAMQIG